MSTRVREAKIRDVLESHITDVDHSAFTQGLWKFSCTCGENEKFGNLGLAQRKRIAHVAEMLEAALSAAPAPDNPNDTMEYWRSRAITAEQKVLEFHEQIALLGAPARDGVREASYQESMAIAVAEAKDCVVCPACETLVHSSKLRHSQLIGRDEARAAKEQADGQG